MTANREKIIEKIKALLSKTVDQGCTEEEALASLTKAQAWMDAAKGAALALGVPPERIHEERFSW